MSSAGIYPQEIDLSLYASNSSDTIFGVVGHFSKGTINGTPQLITSLPDLERNFGKPRSDGNSQAWYACRNFLRRGNQLKVVRVESTATPAVASVSALRGYVQSADVEAAHVDGVTSGAAGQFDSATALFVTHKVMPGDILCISAGADAGYYEVNNVTLETRLFVKNTTAWPSGGAAGQTFTVFTGLRQSLADGATSAPALRTLTSATGKFTAGTTNCNVQVGDILVINDIGTPGDNGVYVIAQVPSATTVIVNRDWPVGSLAALSYQIYTYTARQEIGVSSVPATRTLTSAGHDFVARGVSIGDFLVVNDISSPGDNGVYVITNVAATVLTINQNWPVGSLVGLTFYVLPASVKLTAYTKGTWGDGLDVNVTANAGAPATSVDIEVTEDGVQVEKHFGVAYGTIVTDLASSTYVVPVVVAGRGGIPAVHSAAFAGGVDGEAGIVDGDYIGTSPVKGLQLFNSPDAEQLDCFGVPGVYSQAVGDAIVTIAESRQNCVGLLDPPPWATVDTPLEVTQWHNGLGAFGRTTAVSSSFVAICWPWVDVYDEYNSATRRVAPSGFHAAQFAYTDRNAYPWMAPAGGDRGLLLGATGLPMSPSQGERDYMQGGTNCVNPIVNFAGEGIMIYGQKTCYRVNSARNRLNVRRMLIWLSTRAQAGLRRVVFDPNDSSTWKLVFDVINPLCRFVKKNRGMTDYLVVCDDTNNTATTLSNYQLIVDVYIKPTPTAEVIQLRFVLTSQSANFQELIGA